MKKPIIILDSTLREGEQASQILFSLEEKIQIAHLLKRFGVNLIEIGHPGISLKEMYVCKTICQSDNEVDFLVHSRALETDVIAAHKTGAPWIGIWIAYNDMALKTKFTNKTRGWILEQTKQSVALAKHLGLKVRFTIEDASRTSYDLIEKLAKTALNAGADRISLADTVGKWSPKECYDMVKQAIQSLSCEIEVHLHNDLGLAQANAIAAIEAGATIIDASILGVGERAGICDLFTLATYLHTFHHQNQYQFDLVNDLSEAIQTIGSFACEPHRAIVGRNAFTHSAPYHAKAVKKDKKAYQFLTATQFHRATHIPLKSLTRVNSQRIDKHLKVGLPFIKSVTELLYHREGIGQRWVLMDSRIDDRCSLYVIERIFDVKEKERYQPHVDIHAHHCDSLFIFFGRKENGQGLTVSVTFGLDDSADTQLIHSPASVFIPKNTYHSYQYIDGSGQFINIVLAPNYNESLL